MNKNELLKRIRQFVMVYFLALLCISLGCNTNRNQEKEVYFCPMECEGEKTYDQPGTCPVCKMDLELKETKVAPSEENLQKKFTCPMHPEIVKDQAGQCPICNMDLVEMSVQVSMDKTITIDDIVQPTDQFVISSLKTTYPDVKKLFVKINADGFIAYDIRTYNNIASRYSGRIEKLYVKYNFQKINKGDKLFDIYSPEIVTVQQNLIYLLQNDSSYVELIQKTKQKLILLGLTEQQVSDVEKTGKVQFSLTVHSPYDGNVHGTEKESISSNMAMSKNQTVSGFSVKEGMYVEKGQTVFNVINPDKVWAILKIYDDDISKVKLGQTVEITLESEQDVTIKGKVDFIEPFYESNSKTLNVRVYLDNTLTSNKIKYNSLIAGTFLKAVISTDTVQGLWVPKNSVLDLGKNKIVWLKNERVFEAHEILTGPTLDNWTEVLQGLNQENEIVADAHYLMDSESFIKITN